MLRPQPGVCNLSMCLHVLWFLILTILGLLSRCRAEFTMSSSQRGAPSLTHFAHLVVLTITNLTDCRELSLHYPQRASQISSVMPLLGVAYSPELSNIPWERSRNLCLAKQAGGATPPGPGQPRAQVIWKGSFFVLITVDAITWSRKQILNADSESPV